MATSFATLTALLLLGAAPAASPPLPELREPAQTQDPSVYAERRRALMDAMGEGVAVIYSEGQADELAIMQHGIRLTEEGFRAAVRLVRPGTFEGAVRAEAERVWRAAGSRRTAYANIVGSGGNSTILHYPRSERVMKNGEVMLMDVACEYAHYATNITRTVPVNGHFSAEQRKVY